MYDVKRFYEVHEVYYNTALREIQSGRKLSRWMWYIFPQLKFLGSSYNAIYYGLENTEEAKAFYEDDYLGRNLREITEALLECKSDDPMLVMGLPDDLKLQSSMTLFYIATGDGIFRKVIEKFFDGKYDEKTKYYINM